MGKRVVFFDLEVAVKTNKIDDIGAVDSEDSILHSHQTQELVEFAKNADFICGHNIIHHDLKVLNNYLYRPLQIEIIDTLYWSPLLFPKKPYHSLVKDDKLTTDELNNPVNDSKKARALFYDEVNAFLCLNINLKMIFYSLLCDVKEFKGLFAYLRSKNGGVASIATRASASEVTNLIKREFFDKICSQAPIMHLVMSKPVELAYALALISTADQTSLTPRWLQINYPEIENVIKLLRNTPCENGCSYCREKLNIKKALRRFFGYPEYRKYNDKPLQENAVQAAVNGESLLAIFPTGGGKSITFQIPALMAGESVHGLTVVISPLQSLMKDQVDNLAEAGFTNAVTVNGLLSSIERMNALERLENGSANLLYISPESLRSNTIEKILMSRNVVRFVVDEAHCFSSWGQDFRVDYLYIGDFIKNLQEKKGLSSPIPVSCFTATAKQKVVTDICDYFDKKLGIKLSLFTSDADRENLHYTVLFKDTEDEKYAAVRNLIEAKNCPTIVYVTRTKRAEDLANKLTQDGFAALPFHGQMDPNDKIANQESFIRNETQIIVATSAFGMGVDKKDVQLVIHYNISDSLENYVQEAGRAGRDPSLNADCYILFNNNDLDGHFMLLNQTKLSIGEIQQVWHAVKDLTRTRPRVCCSALEIARHAGWDDTVQDIETRVKTAIAALENAGYIKRGKNVPHLYATSILAKSMIEASDKIAKITDLNDDDKNKAAAIVSHLISSRTVADRKGDEGESRVDYLADRLGIEKEKVIEIVNVLRQAEVLADDLDMSAYVPTSETGKQVGLTIERFRKLEGFIYAYIMENGTEINLKELNEAAQNAKIANASIKNIRTVLYFLAIKNYIKKTENKEKDLINIEFLIAEEKLKQIYQRRIRISNYIAKTLVEEAKRRAQEGKNETEVDFSLVGLYKSYLETEGAMTPDGTQLVDIEDSLLYLSKIEALKLEGGFLVLYNAMEIIRKELDNKIRYKIEDYRLLDEFYKQRIQQIHIVGEYANLMVKDYGSALEFVHDYFQLDFKKFIAKYFKGERYNEINKNITPQKFQQLFGTLSSRQLEIINDTESRYIVVSAGPGSGKTKLLVHKLASLLMMEDVKHEQLLMLTFSRAAATEFKQRLVSLIGNAAYFIDIKTFHSYCFDLLGKIGSLEGSENVVADAAKLIYNGEVEPGKVTKTVLVIDEAQDMDKNELNLVRSLMSVNDEMRIIAVGDDDQNIYEFRGSSSENMALLIKEYGAKLYEMTTNYRSAQRIVEFANIFAKTINNRMKHTNIEANSKEPGEVQLCFNTGENFEQAIVEDIARQDSNKCTCILTNTNEEALRITGMLTNRKIRAKLIQSVDGFRLFDLIEIRTFLQAIDKKCSSPIISDEAWQYAIKVVYAMFRDSSCFENCMNLIKTFEKTNAKQKYKTDLLEFIKESSYDEFYTDDNDTVYVSTIHKSKGREFDNVYILLKNVNVKTDEDRRKLYVGFTRAKKKLCIYHNSQMLKNMEGFASIENGQSYPAAEEITLQLTHRDVVLSYFKNKKELITQLRSGYEIQFDGTYFSYDNRTLAKISQKMVEELSQLRGRGYHISRSYIRFIVAWKGEEDTEECAVLLPNVVLKR